MKSLTIKMIFAKISAKTYIKVPIMLTGSGFWIDLAGNISAFFQNYKRI